MNEPDIEERDADIIVMPGVDGKLEADDATPERFEAAQKSAKRRKAEFGYRIKGAENRAGLLPRQLTAAFAAGATNLMLAQILQGELQPLTAKEAAEVAKITHGIYAAAAGSPKDNGALTPQERERKMNEVNAFEAVLIDRAKQATDAVTAGAPADDEDLSAWEHDGPSPAKS